MKKFINKITDEVVEANNFSELFAFTHNSNYEPYKEEASIKNDDTSQKSTKTKNKKKTSIDGTTDNSVKTINTSGDNINADDIVVNNYSREELIESLNVLEIPFEDSMTDDELLKLIQNNESEKEK